MFGERFLSNRNLREDRSLDTVIRSFEVCSSAVCFGVRFRLKGSRADCSIIGIGELWLDFEF